MKLTTRRLKQLITEEFHKMLHREDETAATPEDGRKIMELLMNGFEKSGDLMKKRSIRQAIMLIEDLFNVKHEKDFILATKEDYQGYNPKDSQIMIFSDNEQLIKTLSGDGGKFKVKEAFPYGKESNEWKGVWKFYIYYSDY